MDRIFKINGPRQTSEIWAPCEPCRVKFRDKTYYRATITFLLLEGKGIALSFGAYNTADEAFQAAIERAKTEPRPDLSGIFGPLNDTDRLDWLASEGRIAKFTDGWTAWKSGDSQHREFTSGNIREAIDQAIEGTKL